MLEGAVGAVLLVAAVNAVPVTTAEPPAPFHA
jgi:hypothetical protein